MDDGLTRRQHAIVQEARRAVAKTVQELADVDEVMALTVLAFVGGFADICSASSARVDLIALMNTQLGAAGLSLVHLARN